MIDDLNCPKCGTKLDDEPESLPWNDDETFEVDCSCGAKLTISASVRTTHTVRCVTHRWIRPWHELEEAPTKTRDGRRYAECMDCGESDFVDQALIKTEEEHQEAE